MLAAPIAITAGAPSSSSRGRTPAPKRKKTVGPDVGQGSGEDGGHGGVATHVDRRQPEVEREEAQLQEESREDQRGHGDHRGGVQAGHPFGDGLHVQAAGDAVERRYADQEHERPQQVDHGEDERRPDLVVLLPVARQDEGGDHGDLEEHVEVERVAREEEPREPRGHEQDQRRERAPAHTEGDLVEHRGQDNRDGNQGERHPEGVGPEGDADALGPAARGRLDRPLPQHHGRQPDQGEEGRPEARRREQADPPLSAVQEGERGGEHPRDAGREGEKGVWVRQSILLASGSASCSSSGTSSVSGSSRRSRASASRASASAISSRSIVRCEA